MFSRENYERFKQAIVDGNGAVIDSVTKLGDLSEDETRALFAGNKWPARFDGPDGWRASVAGRHFVIEQGKDGKFYVERVESP